MSEAIYKRELNHSYMVLKCEDPDVTVKYAYRMMTANRIGRLLDCTQRQMDGVAWLYYDISSRQPLERLYESRKMGVEEIRTILHSIAAMQEDLGEYLLDEQGLLLEAGQMFADVETEELYFCFYPGQVLESRRYAKLADFFLEHVDHGQEHAVNLAYRFYSMSKADYFVLNSFFPFLEKERTAWKQESGQRGPAAEESGFAEVFGQEELLLVDGLDEEKEGMVNEQEARASKAKTSKAKTSKAKDRETKEPETSGGRSGKGNSLFRRLFGKNAKAHVRKKEEPQEAGIWEETVWDSYVKQIEYGGTGETIYFADLKQPDGKMKGIPCLTEENGERQFLLDDLPVTVGKLKGKVSLVLTDNSVSRMHDRFEIGPGGVYLMDLNSRNGTLLNGEKLAPNESMPMKDGDLVQFGRERFRYGFLDSKTVK